VPDSLFALTKLRKLNLSDNKITTMAPVINLDKTYWESLEVLNVCRNQLKVLPEGITKMVKMKMLLVNNNVLDFNGIL
jgi:Leucine-rich repeat (LRR) protein